jgi:hypothetical protein
MHGFRGSAALYQSRRPGIAKARQRQLRELAAADEKALEKLGATAYPFLLLALRCGRALASGRPHKAIAWLRAYLAAPPVSPLLGTLDLQVTRRRLGQLLGGHEGATLVAAGESGMRDMGVVDLERTTEMVLPGCATDYT